MRLIGLPCLGLVAPLLLAGCGSGVTYYKMGTTPASGFSGLDCPASTGPTTTFSGIDGAGTVAICTEANSQYFLDLGSVSTFLALAGDDVGLTGTLSNGVYSFKGQWDIDRKGTPEITTSVQMTVQITPAAPGFSGTVSYQFLCDSTNNSGCGAGNPIAVLVASSDSDNFSCNEKATLIGSQVSGPQEIQTVSTTPEAVE